MPRKTGAFFYPYYGIIQYRLANFCLVGQRIDARVGLGLRGELCGNRVTIPDHGVTLLTVIFFFIFLILIAESFIF